MINITTLNSSYKFLGINYNANTRKHTMIFESIGGDVYVDIERAEFGDFVMKTVESWSEASKHLIEEIKEEMK
jgi:hypothetical protein